MSKTKTDKIMKKLALLLLLVPFIFGCQPYYVQPSEPYLNINGKWKIIDILPTYSEGVQIVDPDFFAVSPQHRMMVGSFNTTQQILSHVIFIRQDIGGSSKPTYSF